MTREQGKRRTKQAGGAPDEGVPLFVAAAHELKSPLALIRQLSLQLETYQANSAEQETIIRQIRLTSERALRMTTGLTKTARLEDSLFTLEPLDPMVLCEEVVDEIRPLYHAKGKQIMVSRKHRTPLILANRDLMMRILLEFADNALHYASDISPVVLSPVVRAKHGRVQIGVRDFGPAVPRRTMSQLARSLGMRSQPMSNRPSSSGLGVYIAHRFADVMNARVGIIRHHDGATFYVDTAVSSQLRLL